MFKIITLSILGILLLIGLGYFGTYPFALIHYSEGERVGKIIKISQKGIFIKNWCGQMALEGMIENSEGGFAPYVLDFGIERGTERGERIKEQLKSLLGQKVKIKYDQRLIENSFIGCNAYLIIGIEKES